MTKYFSAAIAFVFYFDAKHILTGGISDFRISGQFFINENFHNSRTSDDIETKLGPVTTLGKINKTTSKK